MSSSFSTTIFNNAPMTADINRGVEKLITRIIYPEGNPLSPAGDTDIANEEYTWLVKPPSGYYYLPGASQWRCEIQLRAGNADTAPTGVADTCLVMGAPHALFDRIVHTQGGTLLHNDGNPYQTALIQHFKGGSVAEDNTIHTDGYWVDSRIKRVQHTGYGAFGQRIPLRWQFASPFFETGQALWCGGGTHEFKFTGHNRWKSRILDTGIPNCLGNGADQVRVGIFNLAHHAVFAKMDPQYGPMSGGQPAMIMPRHVNYVQDYANTITVQAPQVLEAATVDKTFTVQIPGSVTQVYAWLQEDARNGTAAGGVEDKPLHFFDSYSVDSSITAISIEHDGVQLPTIPYIVATNPAARLRGEEAYNDLVDTLGARGAGVACPITPGVWYGVPEVDSSGGLVHGDIPAAAPGAAISLGSWNLYGFRIVTPVVATAMTNFTVSVSRAAGANLATRLWIACVQPFEVSVTFDDNLNLQEVTKTIM